ncbi:MAG: uracil-DNA glycosylase [Akkermansia sp.]|nr:uracil-DNA glycosylase [Akkermansia sp.]MBR2313993.1 uracil-DNA glycosylase [Akkermansia sp.]
MPTLKQLTVETLTHLAENGCERMAVDDEARGILRQWMLAARKAPSPRPSQSVARPGPSEEPEMSVEQKLAYLRQRAADWKPARRLGTLRDTMVFAVGNPHARLMLVGEAPGYEEERQGEPFVGPAGQLLTRILAAMGLKRSDVYISNVCKFRPSMGENQGTANRAPNPEELAACSPLIMAEIRAIQPECIVCLGGSSARGLLGTQQGVSALRGQWLECQGVPVRVTYHPSYLLRNEALSARRALWEDMLEVMRRLGMPVSEKQQNYFR